MAYSTYWNFLKFSWNFHAIFHWNFHADKISWNLTSLAITDYRKQWQWHHGTDGVSPLCAVSRGFYSPSVHTIHINAAIIAIVLRDLTSRPREISVTVIGLLSLGDIWKHIYLGPRKPRRIVIFFALYKYTYLLTYNEEGTEWGAKRQQWTVERVAWNKMQWRMHEYKPA